MLQIAGFICAIVLVYAVKAAAVVLRHDQLAGQCATFSWMAPREQDVLTAEEWAVEEERAPEPRVSLGTLRHAGRASA